jgi:hypothetical protein
VKYEILTIYIAKAIRIGEFNINSLEDIWEFYLYKKGSTYYEVADDHVRALSEKSQNVKKSSQAFML